jgi:drug/metabolite transporter (DMT)-like permease
MHELVYYAGAAATAALYAIALEKIGRENYEPDFTVVTVALGVALTGGWVALRFTGPLPDLPPQALVWWAWRVVFWMFVATGLPITSWQIWQARRRIRQLAIYITTGGRHGSEADETTALAVESGAIPPRRTE